MIWGVRSWGRISERELWSWLSRVNVSEGRSLRCPIAVEAELYDPRQTLAKTN